MLADHDLVAFVPTTDLDRARTFYGDVLGLEVVEVSPFACVVDANGTTLRVTLVEQLRAQPFTVLGWAVPDLVGAVGELEARGVPVVRYEGIGQDELGVWTAPTGDRVAWFRDPDGNTLSLHEPHG